VCVSVCYCPLQCCSGAGKSGQQKIITGGMKLTYQTRETNSKDYIIQRYPEVFSLVDSFCCRAIDSQVDLPINYNHNYLQEGRAWPVKI